MCHLHGLIKAKRARRLESQQNMATFSKEKGREDLSSTRTVYTSAVVVVLYIHVHNTHA